MTVIVTTKPSAAYVAGKIILRVRAGSELQLSRQLEQTGHAESRLAIEAIDRVPV